jgi:hypothetical protein
MQRPRQDLQNLFSKLPAELMVKIFSSLRLWDLITLMRVNKYFNEVAKSDEAWKGVYKEVLLSEYESCPWSGRDLIPLHMYSPEAIKKIPKKPFDFNTVPELKSHGWYNAYVISCRLKKFLLNYLHNYNDFMRDCAFKSLQRGMKFPALLLQNEMKKVFKILNNIEKFQWRNLTPANFINNWISIILMLRKAAYKVSVNRAGRFFFVESGPARDLSLTSNVLHALANEIVKLLSKHPAWKSQIADLKSPIVACKILCELGDQETLKKYPELAQEYYHAIDCHFLYKNTFNFDTKFLEFRDPSEKPGFFARISRVAADSCEAAQREIRRFGL